jgi:hypothetical protein
MRVRVEHQPFPWSVWILVPDQVFRSGSSDNYRDWENSVYHQLLTAIPEHDICRDPDHGTGCYFCIRLRHESDIAIVKLMYEGDDAA